MADDPCATAASIDPSWPITTEDDPKRVYCSNPICGGVDVHPHYHRKPTTAGTGPCASACDVQGQSLPCELEAGHSYEHEGNADIIAGPDDTETPFLVWWDDDGHAFVGSDKAVNTGRIA